MIPFTQYLRPMGTPVKIEVNRPPEIEAMAQELIADGCRLEVEVSMTGEVSFTVEHEDCEATVIAMEVVPNGPTVLPAVDRLITEAHRVWVKAKAEHKNA